METILIILILVTLSYEISEEKKKSNKKTK